jgi:putative tricarboxylic transport membrane protein
MRAAELLTAALLMGLGGVVLYDALRLGIGWGSDGPQSGFFPFWLAVILVSVCGLVLAQAAWRSGDTPFVTRARAVPVLKVLVPLTAFVVLTGGVKVGEQPLLPPLGLYLAAAIYMACYMRWVGHHSWLAIGLVSLGLPVAAFLIFETWFLVPMPKGPIEAWLGY